MIKADKDYVDILLHNYGLKRLELLGVTKDLYKNKELIDKWKYNIHFSYDIKKYNEETLLSADRELTIISRHLLNNDAPTKPVTLLRDIIHLFRYLDGNVYLNYDGHYLDYDEYKENSNWLHFIVNDITLDYGKIMINIRDNNETY